MIRIFVALFLMVGIALPTNAWAANPPCTTSHGFTSCGGNGTISVGGSEGSGGSGSGSSNSELRYVECDQSTQARLESLGDPNAAADAVECGLGGGIGCETATNAD